MPSPWRREWQMGIRGLPYCTHALGPLMQWFQGDRVVRVCCEDAGSHAPLVASGGIAPLVALAGASCGPGAVTPGGVPRPRRRPAVSPGRLALWQ